MELNSIIVNLFRKTISQYSYRDVTTRRETKISQKFKCEAGFPDYIISERKKQKILKEVMPQGLNNNLTLEEVEIVTTVFENQKMTYDMDLNFAINKLYKKPPNISEYFIVSEKEYFEKYNVIEDLKSQLSSFSD